MRYGRDRDGPLDERSSVTRASSPNATLSAGSEDNPPRLLPGRSAIAWVRFQGLGMLLFAVVFIGGGVAVAIVRHTQAERDAMTGPWIVLTIGAIAVWVPATLGFRSAAYRERAAGYTTIYGDDASIDIPGRGRYVSIPLFSTVGLWQLNARTGAVIRRPGEERD